MSEKNYYKFPLMRIGIIGGGQLAKMMTFCAKKMGFYVTFLDPTPDAPASCADKQIVGDFHDKEKIIELSKESDVITYDIENINVEVLKKLEDEGCKIYPSPRILEVIQDKLLQKEMLWSAGLPTSKFKKVEREEFLEKAISSFCYPVVQKAKRGGYDGRGVFVIRNKDDIKNAIKGETYLEEMIDFEKELAINIARGINGEIKCHPVVEMIFDKRANICDMVIAPAQIERKIEDEVKEIAVETIKTLNKIGNAVGIFGIEMFLTKDKKILINEIAPRTHNSGHYTIEGCITSQFEQHIRAITGMPLGSTNLLSPSVMINILGEEGYSGKPIIEGLKDVLSIEGVSFHFYGKKITKPFRKMGHITVLDKDINLAIKKAKKIKNILKVKSEV